MRKITHLCVTLVMFGLATTLSAQVDPSKPAAISGVVLDDNNKAIPQATLSIDRVEMSVRPGRSGNFLISNLRPGRHLFSIRAIGFEPANQLVELKAGETLDIEVVLPRMTALETNKVIGMSAARAEFEDRRARNIGFAVDTSELNKRVDMLRVLERVPMTTVRPLKFGGASVLVRKLSSRAACAPAAFLDGKRTDMSTVTALPPSEFRAIEILPYEVTPAKYTVMPCGAILFWSKTAKW